MSTQTDRAAPSRSAPPDPAVPPRDRTPSLLPPVGAGVALLLAGTPVGAVVAGTAWWWYAGGVVALTVLVGVGSGVAGSARAAVPRVRPAVVAAAQLAAVAAAVTALFADSGVLGVLPGPTATAELVGLLREAGHEIDVGVAPVPATPAMLLLLTAAFGLAAVAVHAVAVGARAPAAAGVLLLAVFAVPTALADDLLPSWMVAAAGAGFTLLLAVGTGHRGLRRAPAAAGVVALAAPAVVLALAIGTVAEGIGTAGRITGPATGPTRSDQIGLNPFTALRGQLRQGAPTELFRVSGLPRPAYLRALTLDGYVADSGWQPGRPGAGTALTGGFPAVDRPGERVTVTVENMGFRDRWLPLYGDPLGVTGIAADRWAYDPATGTAYSTDARREDRWTQEALLPAPSADALRADGPRTVDPRFSDTTGIDPRVAALAADVTSGARTPFDRAAALNAWFTGPGSAFTYDLSTAEGNGDDAMVEFLTRGRRGYCEQYASAMAAMLRTVGVPARVAVGFTAGREAGGTRTVATTDAHAWVEAWLPGAGWTTFDPTPLSDGRAVVPPYVTEAAGTPGAGPETTARPEPTTPTAAPEPERADATAGPGTGDPPPVPEESTASRPDGALARVLLGLTAAAGLGAVLAVPAVVRSRRRSRRLGAAATGGPGAADAAWAELMAESTDRGVPSRTTETVREAAGRLADAHDLDDPARGALGSLVSTVEASAYGGIDPAPGTLTAPLRVALAAVAAGTPLRPRDRLLPRSVTGELRPTRTGRGGGGGRTGDPDAVTRTGDALSTRR